MPNLQLRKFDIKGIKDGSAVVFIGKRDTGKSFLVKDLLYHKQKLPRLTLRKRTMCVIWYVAGLLIPERVTHTNFSVHKHSS